jgi:tetratricopeptide (TPR) repeat protein
MGHRGHARPIRFPVNRVGALLAIVILFGHQGLRAHPGVEEALGYFDRQIEQSPRDQALYVQRGMVYSNDGQYQKAEADFTRAAALGDPVLVSFELGVLHYRMGDVATSRRYFDAYLQRFPDHAACLEYRARLLRDAGDHDGAIADFRRVLALEAHPNPGNYISLAEEMLESRGDEGIAGALNVLDQANAKLGLTPQIQHKAIELELRRKQPERAIERMRALEPMLGESPDWKVEMGELMLAVGRREDAQAYFRKAVDQLGSLRLTPARQQLMRRAQGHLDGEASAPRSMAAPTSNVSQRAIMSFASASASASAVV